MKIYLIGLLLFTISLTYPQNDKVNKLDYKLIGSWYGYEIENENNNHWILHRYKDGTFLLITTKGDSETTEKGQWWVENSVFYIVFYSTNDTFTYDYQFVTKTKIKFQYRKSKYIINQQDYMFIEKRIKNE